LSFSFIEIYNEEIMDLLDEKAMNKDNKKRKTLKISTTANSKLEIKGLNIIETNSLEQAYNSFLQGSFVRKVR